jgi:hypothetical protein
MGATGSRLWFDQVTALGQAEAWLETVEPGE